MYVSPTACNVLCVRFTQLLFAYQLGSFSRATLDTGGWLGFARQGLSPYKKRQAALGAPASMISRPATGLTDKPHQSFRVGWIKLFAGFCLCCGFIFKLIGCPPRPPLSDDVVKPAF